MNKKDAIRKVTACMKMAGDSGASPAECATALRQARAMMRDFDLQIDDLHAAEVHEFVGGVALGARPPGWATGLMALVARVFGCEVFLCRSGRYSFFHYIGVSPAPSIASYAADVLYRQLRSARSGYIKSLDRRMRRSTKTRRGDLFAIAWLQEVVKTVGRFAGNKPTEAIEAWKRQHSPDMDAYKPRRHQYYQSDAGAAHAGRTAAEGVRLDRPINGRGGMAAIGQQEADG